jgi:2,3-diphosphopglycerate-independent phosphoglycerate mutase
MRARVILILVDGLGDVGVADELKGATPLEYADTPGMDWFATHGLCGLMDPVEPGVACGSDTAHLSLFGYSPQVCYRGRGAFEAMGSGLALQSGDIAFKSVFSTMDMESGIVTHRRVDREFATWGPDLCDALSTVQLPSFPDIQIDVKYAVEHRCGVRLRGAQLSDAVTDTDPLRDGCVLRKCIPDSEAVQSQNAEAKRTSEIVSEMHQEFVKVLHDHPINKKRIEQGQRPANCVLFRGCGVRLQVEPFASRHGMEACAVAPTAIISGVAQTLGMHLLQVKGATGDYHTDLSAKKIAIRDFMMQRRSCRFGFLHIKAVDEAGHDGDINMKVSFLEKIDKMLSELRDELDTMLEAPEPWIFVLTGDHTTPVKTRDHTHEPVPIMLTPIVLGGSSLQGAPDHISSQRSAMATSALDTMLSSDQVRRFHEHAVCKGSLGRFPGSELMPLVRTLAGEFALI